MQQLWTLLLEANTKTLPDRLVLQLQKLRMQNANNTMTSKAFTTFNQWQLRPLVYVKSTGVHGKSIAPFLSGLAKKLVDVSTAPRSDQGLHQHLSPAVVRGTTASILACVQV